MSTGSLRGRAGLLDLFAAGKREIAVTLCLVGVLGLLIIPLPAPALDILLAVSIAFSLVVFLASFYVQDPMDFTVFPVLLLVSTVFRLSLNISSTRLILSSGNTGTAAAGKIIATFGDLVARGDFAIGLVIFLILVIINFVVVTKGAGRIAEVGARFTLDAMPGKQMAIDADLNAGVIGEEEARSRRKAVVQEADFHGAMDGASKFIRGDAIAGMLVTAINLVGGLFIGVVQKGMSPSEAAHTYSVLTIGDGLVSQVPALVISVASAMLVTRVAGSSEGKLQDDITFQLFGSTRVLWVAAAILVPFAFVGGGAMAIPFLLISGFLAATAWFGLDDGDAEKPVGAPAGEPLSSELAEPFDLLEPLEILELEVGFDLIPLVDERKGGELMRRIRRIRQTFANTLGIVVPPIQVRDNLQLRADRYSILLRGTEIGSGELKPGRLLAILAGGDASAVPGLPGKEPAFDLPAVWIRPEDRRQAEIAGCTIADAQTVLGTHLSEVLKAHAADLLGRQEVQHLIDRLAKSYPKVVDELVPNLLPLGTIVAVLRNLLRESVSIRDLLTVLETLADCAPNTQDPEQLTELVRQGLSRQIGAQYADATGTLHAIRLARTAEQTLREGMHREGGRTFLVMDPKKMVELRRRLFREFERQSRARVIPVLLTPPDLRLALRRLIEAELPLVAVLSTAEIGARTRVRPLASVAL
jgi:flagellar biosynthesis protein FlhA